MADTLNGTMIGAGFFAGFQAEAWTRMAGVQIAAVADLDTARARAFADRYGIPRVYADAAEMFARERPDFVDIATRPDSHLSLCTLAADHGVPVICQKPLAPTWPESVSLVRACEQRRTRLFVHENFRFQPWYRECHRLLVAGAIGRPLQVSFRMRTGDGRGESPYAHQPYFSDMKQLLIFETAVHILDTFRFLFGEIADVSCRARRVNPRIAGEDAALITVGFAGGAFGLIDANRISGPMPSPVTMGVAHIEGEDGSLRVDETGHIFLTKAAADGRERPVDFTPITHGYKGDSVKATQEHILSALREGAPAECEGHAYLPTVAAVFASYESARTGRVVALSEFTKEQGS